MEISENDKQFLKDVLFASEIARKINEDNYEVDEEKADRLDKIVRFCYNLKERGHNCQEPKVEIPVGDPVATVVLTFNDFFGLNEIETKELSTILNYADCFTVSSEFAPENGVDVQFVINKLWKRKES